MIIHGIKNLSKEQINEELELGGRFVVFQWCFSVVAYTFKDFSEVYFIKHHESSLVKHFWYTFITIIFGWWGVPFGPIYTLQSLIINFKGGKIVTQESLEYLNNPPRVPKSIGTKTSTNVKIKRLLFIGLALIIFVLIIIMLKKTTA